MNFGAVRSKASICAFPFNSEKKGGVVKTMGKRNLSKSLRVEALSDYEIMRLKRLQDIETKMQAKGLGTLANKVLQSKYNTLSNQQLDIETSDEEEGEYEPSEGDEDIENLINQPLTMDGRAKLKSQTVQQSLKQTLEQPKEKHQRLERLQPPHQHLPKQKQHAHEKKKQKKSQEIRYCSPGSIAAYKNLRQRQQEQGRQRQQEKGRLSNSLDNGPASGEDFDHILLEENFENQLLRDENVTDNATDVLHEDYLDIERQSVIPSVTDEKKHRGPSTLMEVHQRTLEEREMIILNVNGQPIGHTDAIVLEFSRFLGTLAKCPHRVPLSGHSWTYVPTKEHIWEYVKEKYIIPEEGKKFVLDTVGALWRQHKSRLKRKHYTKYKTDEERLAKRPKNIPVNQFEELLKHWNSLPVKDKSEKNKRSRKMKKDVHTMGPKSYALLRHNLQAKDPNKKPPSQTMVYKESRKRVAGRVYKTKDEKTAETIEKMNALESQYKENGEDNSSKDPYCEVVSNGQLHMFGRSVTKRKLNGKEKAEMPSYILPPELLQSIKAELVQQAVPDLISLVASKIQDANPGADLIIPDITISPRETSSAMPCQQNGSIGDSLHQDNGLRDCDD